MKLSFSGATYYVIKVRRTFDSVLMLTHTFRIRSAVQTDHLALNNLFHFEPFIFRHLDWKQPLDWLGEQPFLVAEQQGRILAALICPPDPPGVAWVRTFAASGQVRLEQVWQALWDEALRVLTGLEPAPNGEQKTMRIAALCIDAWMQKLLKFSGFREKGSVVVLSWDQGFPLAPPRFKMRPRLMTGDDLIQVYELDRRCFEPLWQNSLPILKLAFQQAIFATVVESDSGIIGYQISTPGPHGGHLARLAVHPKSQGQGIGYAMVYDLLIRFANYHQSSGQVQVTVNTQEENTASLTLYKKANFKITGHKYPVYELF